MDAQSCIDAAALTAAERGILAAGTPDVCPWAAALLTDLETAASIAAERAAAGERVTLLALAQTLAGWAGESEAAPPGAPGRAPSRPSAAIKSMATSQEQGPSRARPRRPSGPAPPR